MKQATLFATAMIAFIPNAYGQQGDLNECPKPYIDVEDLGSDGTASGTLKSDLNGQDVLVCENGEGINILNLGIDTASFHTCDEMANSVNGGVGYAPQGDEVGRLWFWVAPEGEANSGRVQIGLYLDSDNEPERWWVTDWRCTR